MRPIVSISYSSHFARAMKAIPASLSKDVEEREALFRRDALHPSLRMHKLKGKFKHLWSFSITQKHRIVFRFITDTTVEFIDVGDHSVYH